MRARVDIASGTLSQRSSFHHTSSTYTQQYHLLMRQEHQSDDEMRQHMRLWVLMISRHTLKRWAGTIDIVQHMSSNTTVNTIDQQYQTTTEASRSKTTSILEISLAESKDLLRFVSLRQTA